MEVGLPDRVRIGTFEVDLRAGELHGQDGKVRRLQEQPFQILRMLVERSGGLVTREEVQEKLWPNDVVVEFDHSIHAAINKLRQAFGDSAETPRYIETVARRGYRLMTAVEQVDGNVGCDLIQTPGPELSTGQQANAEIATQSSDAAQSPPQLAWKRYALRTLCAVLLVIGFAAYHSWFRSRVRTRNVAIGPKKIKQISDWNKPIYGPVLSPDGHAIAFSSPTGGVDQVFLMLTTGGEPLQLTSGEGGKYATNFSPDGKEIYYTKVFGRYEIWAIPTLGGIPRKVVFGAHAVPSPDGTSILYVKADSPGIFRANISGLGEELVYEYNNTERFLVPKLLFPSGNELLVASVPWRSPTEEIQLLKVNLTTHQAIDLGNVVDHWWEFVWAEAGNSVLSSRTVDGLDNIWKYNLPSRTFTQITFGPGGDRFPMPTSGGKGIYFVSGKGSNLLTTYHMHSRKSTDIALNATQPTISPNGRRVMYVTSIGELWISDIDGGAKVKIATGKRLQKGNWAGDNFHLSFWEDGEAKKGDQLYVVGADGSGLGQVPTISNAVIVNTTWSSDLNSIYASIWQGPAYQIWKWNLGGASPKKFVDKCGFVTDAHPSGQYLLSVQPEGEGTGIYEISVSDRKCTPLLTGVVTYDATFAGDGRSFLYTALSHGEVAIYRQPWKDGKLAGSTEVALRLPFIFRLSLGDFSKNLSSVVYVNPIKPADFYLLSQ